MYIDLEGVDICHEGSLSILTPYDRYGNPDQTRLPLRCAFAGRTSVQYRRRNTEDAEGYPSDNKIPNVIFDVRNDSDASFAHFGVALQGLEDVQLMESATRRTTGSRKFLSGLAKCVEKNVLISLHSIDLASWKAAKEKGTQLFKAEHGSSYEVFNQRPEEIILYCVGHVKCLPELRGRFWKGPDGWRDLVNEETKKRVAASQKSEYQPHGPDRTMAPWTEDQNRALDKWNYVPPSCDYFDEDWFDEDWHDDRGDNDFEDWTRAPWQGPLS